MGLGRKLWTGETLSVPDLQGYLQDQTVMSFPSAAARTAAIPAPAEGMVSHLIDTDTWWGYGPNRATGAVGWQPMAWGDTGWQPMTVIGPVVKGSEGADLRVVGGMATLRLHITYNNTWASGFVFMNLPTWGRPTKGVPFDGLFFGAVDRRFELNMSPDGNVRVARGVPADSANVVASVTYPAG